MDRLTKKEIIVAVIALIMLWIGVSFLPPNEPAAEKEPAAAGVSDIAEPNGDNAAPAAQGNGEYHEKIIYTCRLGTEEIPAVQIAEVVNSVGENIAVTARVSGAQEMAVTVPSSRPVWDESAVSARSVNEQIIISHEPKRSPKDYDWVLTLMDNDTVFRERVRNCQEVSDE